MQQVNKAEIDRIFVAAEKLRNAGELDKALTEYSRVALVAPDHWPSLFHLGCGFAQKGNLDVGVALLRRAEKINPKNAVIKNHLADHLLTQGEISQAVKLFQASWELDSGPENTSALLKLGRIYREDNQLDLATEYFDALVAAENGEEDASFKRMEIGRWFRCLCYLAKGDYEEGWKDYDARHHIPGVVVPKLEGERWTGQPLKGKTIFLSYEQRFGDLIQFMRFVPMLTNKGAKVVMHVPPELMRQLSQDFPDVRMLPISEPVPAYDYYQFVTSIPEVLKLSKQKALKQSTTYLKVQKADRSRKVGMRPKTELKVGLVWAGKPDPDRSISLTHYLPLLKHDLVSFYSFQLGQQREDLGGHGAGWLIKDLSGEISDFYDSSVLLKQMDLLITIDTAIAHQAGALGVPTWLMLRYFSDWRWELDRDDSDWYWSLRLFRQHAAGDWSEAAARMQSAFDQWVKKETRSTRKKAG